MSRILLKTKSGISLEKISDWFRILVTNLQIGAFLKFLPTLEEWKFLGLDCHIFTGPGVPAGVGFIVLDKKAA